MNATRKAFAVLTAGLLTTFTTVPVGGYLAALPAGADHGSWQADLETEGHKLADIETEGRKLADLETEGHKLADIETEGQKVV
jgi:hypothetical protein